MADNYTAKDYSGANVVFDSKDIGSGVQRPRRELAAGEAHIGEIGGRSKQVRVEKTRPADTAAYIVNDAIAESTSAGTVWTFALPRISGGSGVIVGALVSTDNAVNVAALEMDLYDDTITAINDNVEATRLYANQAKFIGTIVFPALVKKTTNSTQAEAVPATAPSLAFKSVGANVYGILRTLTAFTPVSGAKYQVTLSVLLD